MRQFVWFSLSVALLMGLVLVTHAQLSEKAQLGRELFHDPTFKGTLEPKKATGFPVLVATPILTMWQSPMESSVQATVSSVCRTAVRRKAG